MKVLVVFIFLWRLCYIFNLQPDSLEKKEERITELLVLVTTAEKAKRDSEAEIQRILQMMSELQQVCLWTVLKLYMLQI